MIDLDFETFSAAGFRWDAAAGRWRPLEGARKSGLPAIGAELYAMHKSTRVICLAWDSELWIPGMDPPVPLWDHVRAGGMLSAWNSQFEWWIWNRVLVPQGWPEMKLDQIVDIMQLPEPTGGLASGIILLAVLAHRRSPARNKQPDHSS